VFSRAKLNLLAEHVADPALDRVFPHQMELRVRLKLPHRDFREGNCDDPVAEWIFSRMVDVIEISPSDVHTALIAERLFGSRPVAHPLIVRG
jgi:hypothetical protein